MAFDSLPFPSDGSPTGTAEPGCRRGGPSIHHAGERIAAELADRKMPRALEALDEVAHPRRGRRDNRHAGDQAPAAGLDRTGSVRIIQDLQAAPDARSAIAYFATRDVVSLPERGQTEGAWR